MVKYSCVYDCGDFYIVFFPEEGPWGSDRGRYLICSTVTDLYQQSQTAFFFAKLLRYLTFTVWRESFWGISKVKHSKHFRNNRLKLDRYLRCILLKHFIDYPLRESIRDRDINIGVFFSSIHTAFFRGAFYQSSFLKISFSLDTRLLRLCYWSCIISSPLVQNVASNASFWLWTNSAKQSKGTYIRITT